MSLCFPRTRSAVVVEAIADSIRRAKTLYTRDTHVAPTMYGTNHASCSGSAVACAVPMPEQHSWPMFLLSCRHDFDMLLQVCQAFNESYWQCVPAASSDASPETTSVQVAAYAQCGGINCQPVLGDLAEAVTCSNAAWDNVQCTDSSTSCQRVDDYMWQCLPTSGDVSPNPGTSSSDDDSDSADESDSESGSDSTIQSVKAMGAKAVDNAQAMGEKAIDSAKSVGAKAVSGAKAMGAKAMNIVKAQSYDDTDDSSPTPDSDPSDAEASPTEDSPVTETHEEDAPDADSVESDAADADSADDDTSDDDADTDDDSTDTGDLDILTFAFNLECLQVSMRKFCRVRTDCGA